MSKTTMKNSEKRRPSRATDVDDAQVSLGQVFKENRGKPWRDRALIERFFATMATDLSQREVSKCWTR